MSVSITVERSPANRQGPHISDPLIAADAQARERGRREIDKNCSDRVVVSGVCPLHHYMAPGSLVNVADIQAGQYRALLKSFALVIERQADGSFTAVTNITMERVA